MSLMQPKRIILMYISEVSGHHSATNAIEKALKYLFPRTEVLNINAFNYTNPISEKIVNRLYMGVIKRTPKIWDYLYDNPTIVKKIESLKQRIHTLNSSKLQKLFDKFRPDAVACAQAFPCGMVADYKRTYGSTLPLVAVLTDYVPHAYWIYEEVDYYISPSEDVAMRLIEKGVPVRKIKTFGIPFDHTFNEKVDAHRLKARLGLQTDVFTVLIMGGGQGLGPIKTIVRSLERLFDPMQMIVVCGTNKKLYNSLRRKIKKYKKKCVLFGYTDTINELMSVSDIIITKPGGITTAEALTKQLPIIIVKPIPGQEINNTVYLTKKGAAVKIDKPEEVGRVVQALLLDPQRRTNLRQAAGFISKPDASLDIAGLLLRLGHG